MKVLRNPEPNSINYFKPLHILKVFYSAEYSSFVNFGCEKLILFVFLLLKYMLMEDAGSPITVRVLEMALYKSKFVFKHN